jgi:hypothetical protein
MSRQITKELALKIVKKCGAVDITQKGDAHDTYGFEHNGQYVVALSVRRGSEKDQGHDHIQRQMHVNTYFAKEFARCNKSVQEWIEKLIEANVIPRPVDPQALQ